MPPGIFTSASGGDLDPFRRGPTAGPERQRVFLIERISVLMPREQYGASGSNVMEFSTTDGARGPFVPWR